MMITLFRKRAIATTNELNMEEVIDVKPRNWIPQRKWSSQSHATPQPQARNSYFREHLWKSRPFPDRRETGEVKTERKDTTLTCQESTRESGEHSQNSRPQSAKKGTNCLQSTKNDVKSANLKNILKICRNNSGVS